MNDWRKPCKHGHYGPHDFIVPPCPGGSPVTAADLEGLGEEYARGFVCVTENQRTGLDAEGRTHFSWDNGGVHREGCGWFVSLLIPIPDPQPATSDDFTADMMARVDYGPDEDDDK